MHFIDNETLHNPGLGPNNQFSCIEPIPDSVMWPQSSVLLWRILTALYCKIANSELLDGAKIGVHQIYSMFNMLKYVIRNLLSSNECTRCLLKRWA